MTPQQFIAKWKPVALTERATAQSHFLDLCTLLGHDDPVSADPVGEWFTFEKGVEGVRGADAGEAHTPPGDHLDVLVALMVALGAQTFSTRSSACH